MARVEYLMTSCSTKEKERRKKKKPTRVHNVRFSYSVIHHLLLIFKETCEVFATHRFRPDIVTTLSVDDILLRGGGRSLDIVLESETIKRKVFVLKQLWGTLGGSGEVTK